MRNIPRKTRGRRNQFFDAEGVDELLSCVLRLMSEVSAIRERQYVTERMLKERGVDVSDAIEAWQPSAADAVWLEAERERMIATVLAQLHAPPSQPSRIESTPLRSRPAQPSMAGTATAR